jgi:hypothetical protein
MKRKKRRIWKHENNLRQIMINARDYYLGSREID